MMLNTTKQTVHITKASIGLQENSSFMEDILDFFSKEKAGHIGHWEYSQSLYPGDPVCGAEYWSAFIRESREYYLSNNEIALLERAGKDIAALVNHGHTVIDLGPGSLDAIRNKTIPILKHISSAKTYVPVDFCDTFISGNFAPVRLARPELNIKPCKADFFKDDIDAGTPPRTILFLGGTIANLPGDLSAPLPVEQLSQFFRHQHKLAQSGYFVITHDSCQEGARVIQSYTHEKHILFSYNIMYRIARDLPLTGSFDPSPWHYEPVWEGKHHRLAHTIVADKQQSFQIGLHKFNVKKGERFVSSNSYKYPADLFLNLASQAGFEHLETFSDDKGWVKTHVLKAR